MNALSATDEPYRGEPVAPTLERIVCGLEHGRVVGQAKIIVGAKIQHGLSARHTHAGLLRRCQNSLSFVSAGRTDFCELLCNAFSDRFVHSQTSWLGRCSFLMRSQSRVMSCRAKTACSPTARGRRQATAQSSPKIRKRRNDHK